MSDLIDRQAALDALEWTWAGKAAIDAIKELPAIKTISLEEAIEEYNKGLCDAIAKAVFSIRSYDKDDSKGENK